MPDFVGTVRMEAFIEPRLSDDSHRTLPGLSKKQAATSRATGSSYVHGIAGAGAGSVGQGGAPNRCGAVYDDSFDPMNAVFGGF